MMAGFFVHIFNKLCVTLPPQDELVDPEEDETTRKQHREHVLSGGVVKEFQNIGMTRTKGEDGETREEYDFNSEVNLGVQAPIWKEKYKPRKPRFFNRVHTVCWVLLELNIPLSYFMDFI